MVSSKCSLDIPWLWRDHPSTCPLQPHGISSNTYDIPIFPRLSSIFVQAKWPVPLLQANGRPMIQEPQHQGTNDHVEQHHGQNERTYWNPMESQRHSYPTVLIMSLSWVNIWLYIMLYIYIAETHQCNVLIKWLQMVWLPISDSEEDWNSSCSGGQWSWGARSAMSKSRSVISTKRPWRTPSPFLVLSSSWETREMGRLEPGVLQKW